MALSRKRERELKRLRREASELWDDQREVLGHAGKVVREAGRQVGHIGREEVSPRVRDTIDHRIKPTVTSARNRITHDMVPSLATAIASALAAVEVAKDAKLKEASRQLSKAGEKASKAGRKVSKKVSMAKPEPKKGPGRYILLGLGVVAAASVAYAAWQTLREDDDLWISDEPEALPSGDLL